MSDKPDNTIEPNDSTHMFEPADKTEVIALDVTTVASPIDAPIVEQEVDPERQTVVLADASEALKAKILKKMEASSAVSKNDALIGTEIAGRFSVIERIGEGGMGVVYKARQRNMDRAVAIKVLLREMAANKTVEKRFFLEALAVSKLKHPNTIQIFDFGDTEDGQLYIAMEFLEGRSLKQVLKEEQVLSVVRSIRIAVQMLRSLREAHSKGIVHRDLKPDNVFLCQVGEDSDFVKVLDFGVAKLKESGEDGAQANLTKTGAIFGTPRYMSPEQSVSSNVDHRSDLYAIGVLLFELLTGRAPFEAEMPLSLLIMHVQDPVPSMGSVRPDLVIPPQMEAVVQKLLIKDPNGRYQNAEAAIRALEGVEKELDDIYRTVVTSEYAQEIGLELSHPVSTLQNTALNASHAQMVRTMAVDSIGQATELGLDVNKKKTGVGRWLMALVALLALCAGGAILALESLPGNLSKDGQASAVSDESWTRVERADDFSLPTVETVTITLNSEPTGARIFEGKQDIGFTPSTITRHRNQNTTDREWRLVKPGFEAAPIVVAMGKDTSHNIKLKPEAVSDVSVKKTGPGKRKTPRKKKVATKMPTKPVVTTVKKVVKPVAVVVSKPKKPKKPKKKKDPFAKRVHDTK